MEAASVKQMLLKWKLKRMLLKWKRERCRESSSNGSGIFYDYILQRIVHDELPLCERQHLQISP